MSCHRGCPAVLYIDVIYRAISLGCILLLASYCLSNYILFPWHNQNVINKQSGLTNHPVCPTPSLEEWETMTQATCMELPARLSKRNNVTKTRNHIGNSFDVITQTVWHAECQAFHFQAFVFRCAKVQLRTKWKFNATNIYKSTTVQPSFAATYLSTTSNRASLVFASVWFLF